MIRVLDADELIVLWEISLKKYFSEGDTPTITAISSDLSK